MKSIIFHANLKLCEFAKLNCKFAPYCMNLPNHLAHSQTCSRILITPFLVFVVQGKTKGQKAKKKKVAKGKKSPAPVETPAGEGIASKKAQVGSSGSTTVLEDSTAVAETSRVAVQSTKPADEDQKKSGEDQQEKKEKDDESGGQGEEEVNIEDSNEISMDKFGPIANGKLCVFMDQQWWKRKPINKNGKPRFADEQKQAYATAAYTFKQLYYDLVTNDTDNFRAEYQDDVKAVYEQHFGAPTETKESPPETKEVAVGPDDLGGGVALEASEDGKVADSASGSESEPFDEESAGAARKANLKKGKFVNLHESWSKLPSNNLNLQIVLRIRYFVL